MFPSIGVYLFSGLGKMSVLVFKGCTHFLQELRYCHHDLRPTLLFRAKLLSVMKDERIQGTSY